MSCFALTWPPELLDIGHRTRHLLDEARLFAFQPCSSGRSSKPATEKKKRKKKQTRKAACLAGGCRLASPSRRQPRPRTPFPTQLPFGSRQGTAGSSVRMTDETGCPLAGSGEVGVVGRDSGGQSLFLLQDERTAENEGKLCNCRAGPPVSYRASHPVALRGLPQMCDRRCAPSSSLSLNNGAGIVCSEREKSSPIANLAISSHSLGLADVDESPVLYLPAEEETLGEQRKYSWAASVSNRRERGCSRLLSHHPHRPGSRRPWNRRGPHDSLGKKIRSACQVFRRDTHTHARKHAPSGLHPLGSWPWSSWLTLAPARETGRRGEEGLCVAAPWSHNASKEFKRCVGGRMGEPSRAVRRCVSVCCRPWSCSSIERTDICQPDRFVACCLPGPWAVLCASGLHLS